MTITGLRNTKIKARPQICKKLAARFGPRVVGFSSLVRLAGFSALTVLALSLPITLPTYATKLNARPLPHAGSAPGAAGTDADVNEYGRPIKDFANGKETTLPPSQWRTRKLDYRDQEKKDKDDAEQKQKDQVNAVKKAQDDRINAIKQYQQIAIDANNKAIALGKQGHLTEAIAQHELALKYDPTNKQFKINLSAAQTLFGQKLLAQKDYAGAANMFRKALVSMADNGQAGKYLSEAIQRMGLDPNLSDNRLGIGDQLAAAGDISGANIEYQQAMRIDPSARTYTKMGDMAMRYGQAANAVNWYRQAVVKDPEYGPAHRQLGNLMLAMKDNTGAAAELRKAVILDSKDIAAGQGLIEIWRRQVALNPGLAENHLGLATAMQLTGDFGTAENEYNLVQQLDPRNASLAAGRASLQRAFKHTAAEKHCDAAETFYNQGLGRDALAEIGQAVMIDPRNAKYQFLLGQCLESSGDLQGAKQAYHTCVLIDPKNNEAAAHLRDVENGLGQGGQGVQGGQPRQNQAVGLSRPDAGGSQAGQQNAGMGIGSRKGSGQGSVQGSAPGPTQGSGQTNSLGQNGGAAGRDKNMFEGNPQTSRDRTPSQGANATPGQSAAPQSAQRWNNSANQSSPGPASISPAMPTQIPTPVPTIDPQTQATLTAADNLEMQRDFQGAANLLKQSLNNNLQNAEIHHRLAVNMLNLGQLEEAVSEFRIASALTPSSKVFMEDYARALKIHKKAMMSGSGDFK